MREGGYWAELGYLRQRPFGPPRWALAGRSGSTSAVPGNRLRAKRPFLAKHEIAAYRILYTRKIAGSVSNPANPARPLLHRNRSPAARDAAWRGKAERERRVVDLPDGGLSRTGIAAREGGKRRSGRAPRAPRLPLRHREEPGGRRGDPGERGRPALPGSPRPFRARDDGMGSDGSRRECPAWPLRTEPIRQPTL